MGRITNLPENPSPEEMGVEYSYDPNFHGVDEDRKCTDVCMAVVFIIFLCGMFALFFYTIPNSNPMYLYIPTDHRGLVCGFDNTKLTLKNGVSAENLVNLEGKPYLFWVRPGKFGYARSFCVESCPETGSFSSTFLEIATTDYFPYGKAQNEPCGGSTEDRATLHNYSADPADTTSGYFCTYASFLFAQRCFPSKASLEGLDDTTLNEVSKSISEAFGTVGNGITAVSDVYNSWPYIAACVGVAFVLAIIWVMLLRWLASFFVWLTVLLSIAALGFLTYMTYAQRNDAFSNAKATEAYTFGLISQDLNKTIFNVLFWILVALDVIFLLVLLFLCDRIRLSIGIIEIVSKVFGEVWSLFFFPIITYLIMIIWWVYIIVVAVFLYGAGQPSYAYSDEYAIERVNYEYNSVIQGLSIYHFVGFLWVTFFIADLAEMSVAGVFASYYFTREPKRQNMPRHPLASSFGRSLKYHIGSLATGSLIITICRMIRVIIEYIDQKTKNSQSTAVKYLVKCLKCCFWCLEKFLKYLNRNVYVMIAIHGEGFWPSCVKSFQLILRNCVRVATINWVGDFTLFLGRVFVAGSTTGLSLWLFNYIDADITFVVAPAVFVFLFSYFASGAFTNVFEIGIDSIFLCFMEDEERNDGSPGREKYAPEDIREFLSNANSA